MITPLSIFIFLFYSINIYSLPSEHLVLDKDHQKIFEKLEALKVKKGLTSSGGMIGNGGGPSESQLIMVWHNLIDYLQIIQNSNASQLTLKQKSFLKTIQQNHLYELKHAKIFFLDNQIKSLFITSFPLGSTLYFKSSSLYKKNSYGQDVSLDLIDSVLILLEALSVRYPTLQLDESFWKHFRYHVRKILTSKIIVKPIFELAPLHFQATIVDSFPSVSLYFQDSSDTHQIEEIIHHHLPCLPLEMSLFNFYWFPIKLAKGLLPLQSEMRTTFKCSDSNYQASINLHLPLTQDQKQNWILKDNKIKVLVFDLLKID